ncbi:MAG: DUF6141 family protein [Ginsengibacter sp.]
MDTNILFSETQRFKQWWLWIILIAINALMLFGVYTQVINGQQFGDKPAGNSELLTGCAISILITVFVISIRLDTLVKEDGIYVRFFPLQLSYRFFPWNTLTECYVRKYNPIAEYGGWGWRLGLFGKGTAYNISGNEGLQLQFTNDKKLLIGTQKSEELQEVINRFR